MGADQAGDQPRRPQATSSNPANRRQDLKADGFPLDLDWRTAEQEASLEKLRSHLLRHCESCISWYWRSKGPKSFWGVWLRFLSILLVALAGVIPLLADLIPRQFGERTGPMIAPGWSAVMLACAALLSGVDRFLGLTSGWVRYVRTAQALTERLNQFHFDWEELRRRRQVEPGELPGSAATLADGAPLPQQAAADPIKAATDCGRQFLSDVQLLVRRETDLWAREFERATQLLDHSGLDQGALSSNRASEPPAAATSLATQEQPASS
ncbi:MAG: SLATT domain-containing protein [Cyanobium sp.]